MSKFHANKLTTTLALKEVENCVSEIQPHLRKTVTENLNKRLHMCRQSSGALLTALTINLCLSIEITS